MIKIVINLTVLKQIVGLDSRQVSEHEVETQEEKARYNCLMSQNIECVISRDDDEEVEKQCCVEMTFGHVFSNCIR